MLKNLRGLTFLVVLFLVTAATAPVPGCATTGGGGGTAGSSGTAGAPAPSPTQVFGTCSTDALRKTGESLIGRLTSALATGGYEAAVVSLLGQFTASEIGCGVDLVVSLYTKKAARTNDTETQVVLVHAQAFRAAHPAN